MRSDNRGTIWTSARLKRRTKLSDKTHLLPSPSDRPFALTEEKYSTESACGEVKGSNFPFHEVQSLPGYSERNTSGLSASGVTSEAGPLCRQTSQRNKVAQLPATQRAHIALPMDASQPKHAAMGRNPEGSTIGPEERPLPADRPPFRLLPATGKAWNQKEGRTLETGSGTSHRKGCAPDVALSSRITA